MRLPLLGVIVALFFFGRKKKNQLASASPSAEGSAQRAAEQAFDAAFEAGSDEDAAASVAIQAYQQAGGQNPVFVAQIQYWTGAR